MNSVYRVNLCAYISRFSVSVALLALVVSALSLQAQEPVKNEAVTKTLALEQLTPEQQAARDAEFNRLVAEAEAYEKSMSAQTPEEADAGKGPARVERVRLYRKALEARPGDPRNAEVLFRIAQAYHCVLIRKAGEKHDYPKAAEYYERVLDTANEDFPHTVMVKVMLADIYKRLGNKERALELVRPILLMPLPDMEPPDYEEIGLNYLTSRDKEYERIERAKAGALYLYYQITVHSVEPNPERRTKEIEKLQSLILGRKGQETIDSLREQNLRDIKSRTENIRRRKEMKALYGGKEKREAK